MGNRVRELRKSKGLTAEELARRVGLSRRGLTNIERGFSSPRVSTLVKIAYELETPIETLIYEEEEERTKTPA